METKVFLRVSLGGRLRRLQDAFDSLRRAWEAYAWREDSIGSLDFMEAALQLLCVYYL